MRTLVRLVLPTLLALLAIAGGSIVLTPAAIASDPGIPTTVYSYVGGSECGLPMGEAQLRQDYPESSPQLVVTKQLRFGNESSTVEMHFSTFADRDDPNNPQKNCAGWFSVPEGFTPPTPADLDFHEVTADTPEITLSGPDGMYSYGLRTENPDIDGLPTGGELVITNTIDGTEQRYPMFYRLGGYNDYGPMLYMSTLRE